MLGLGSERRWSVKSSAASTLVGSTCLCVAAFCTGDRYERIKCCMQFSTTTPICYFPSSGPLKKGLYLYVVHVAFTVALARG
jgi:hypothetical protein